MPCPPPAGSRAVWGTSTINRLLRNEAYIGRMLPEQVTEARALGATWAGIATALATSPEQAELRYDPESRIRALSPLNLRQRLNRNLSAESEFGACLPSFDAGLPTAGMGVAAWE